MRAFALARTSLEYSAFVSKKIETQRCAPCLLYASAASEVALYMSTRLVSNELARALARTLWLLYPASAAASWLSLYMSTCG